MVNRPLSFFRRTLGPGLITGAADDDPSGIATYSQAGAQFGYGLLWTIFLTTPFMIAIQSISARIGIATGKGIIGAAKASYPRPLVASFVLLLLAANIFNIAADLAAMAEALRLIAGGPIHLYAALFGLFCLTLEIFIPYRKYAPYLKFLTLTLFAYVATAFCTKVDWEAAGAGLLLPHFSQDRVFWFMVIAVLGTTISPYLFFWQAAQEVEEAQLHHEGMLRTFLPEAIRKKLRDVNLDTSMGMIFSNLISGFIIITSAATLHQAGLTQIESAADAAAALRPLAGNFTFLVFASGIIGTGLLAIPVLAGSSAYSVAEFFGWRDSLELKPLEAKGFYGVIALATFAGIALGFTKASPIQMLLWSALINGIIAVPMMIMLMMLATNKQVMGQFYAQHWLRRAGWGAAVLMVLPLLALIAAFFS